MNEFGQVPVLLGALAVICIVVRDCFRHGGPS